MTKAELIHEIYGECHVGVESKYVDGVHCPSWKFLGSNLWVCKKAADLCTEQANGKAFSDLPDILEFGLEMVQQAYALENLAETRDPVDAGVNGFCVQRGC